MSNKVPAKEKISYGIAGFGQNMTITFVNTYLMVFVYGYMNLTEKGLAALTVIMFVAKIWDAVNDPVMGGIIDKVHFRNAKLRPFILISVLPVTLFTILLFAIPAGLPEAGKLAIFGIAYILWDTAYTVCDVPYWGLTSTMTPDTEERTKLISVARTFGNVGLGVITLIGVSLAKWFSKGDSTTASGWAIAATVVTVAGMGLFSLSYFMTKERNFVKEKETSFKDLLKALKINKPLQIILIGSVVGFGRTLIQVSGSTVALVTFGDEGKFTLMGAAVLVSMICSTIVTPFILRKIGKKKLMIWSSLIAAAIYLAMYFIPLTEFYVILAGLFLTGFSLGFFMVLQTAMVADSVDYVEVKTGERNEGGCFAAMTFSGKLMNALATLTFMVIMLVVHYEQGVVVTDTMRKGAYFAVTVIPAISCALGTIPFFFYPLTDEEVRRNSESLSSRSDNAEVSE